MILHFDIQAQVNLVPNPSFEELDSCQQLAEFLEYGIAGWYSPTTGTSDVYNSCTGVGDGSGVPYNSVGWQEARSGVGYAGLIPYEDIYFMGQTGWFVDSREYIQSELDEYLIEGGTYNVSFFVSVADYYATCYVSGLGAYISSTPITTGIPFGLLDFEAQAISMEVSSDSINWVEISGKFVASGNEKFLTIGNFKHDSEIQIDCVSDTVEQRYAYYYIDDVSLILDSINYQVHFPNIISPNFDGINDEFYFELIGYVRSELSIYNRWGKQIFFSDDYEQRWKGNGNVEGVYFYNVILQKRNGEFDKKKGYVQLVK